jgi:tRNA A-37 threonylcarbamoyl transferase component Bud32
MVRAMQPVTGAGRVVAGRYRLLDQIGQGAMGTVWRASDLVLTRDIAIKQVRLPELMTDDDRRVLRERTLREARVSAKLNHPGVVTVHDVIEADGSPWIVMELVTARSLEQVLAEEGPLPPQQAAETGVMLLGALASAHATGIVHRDVKPGNVLLTRDGRAVLTDFGIATLDGDPGLTQAGMVMGTPGFCAPERIRGEPASPASDLWSLGATLYAAVEGRGPFDSQGSPMAILASIVHSDPPPVRLAGPLGTVIGALLSRDPAQRPDAACAVRLLTDAATAGPGARRGAAAPHVPGSTPPPATYLSTPPPAAGPGARPTYPPAPLPGPPAHAPASAGAGTSRAGAGPAQPTASTWPAGFPGPAVIPGGMKPGPFPGTGPGPFPGGSAAAAPPGVTSGPGVNDRAADGTAQWPAGQPGHHAAGPAGAPSQRPRRVLVAGIGGIAIICAGLAIGVALAGGPAPTAPGRGRSSAGPGGLGATRTPPGYHLYAQPAASAPAAAGFSLAVPDGWPASRQGTTTYLRDPAAGETTTIRPVPFGAVGPVREARALERTALSQGFFVGYHRIAISPLFLRGALGAAWRFTYRQPGTGVMEALAVITQLTTPGGSQPYELMVTAPAVHWHAARSAFLEALRTFGPRP